MGEREKPIVSPCHGQCDVNKGVDLCRGCFRTIGEIREWRTASNDVKRAILEQVGIRKAASGKSQRVEITATLQRHPCINQCAISPGTFLCKGCYLYPDEVDRWHKMDQAERARLLEQIERRRRKYAESPSSSGAGRLKKTG